MVREVELVVHDGRLMTCGTLEPNRARDPDALWRTCMSCIENIQGDNTWARRGHVDSTVATAIDFPKHMGATSSNDTAYLGRSMVCCRICTWRE